MKTINNKKYFKTMNIDGKEISKIIIYEAGKVLYTSNCGWIEGVVKDYINNNTEIKSFNLLQEPKKALKLNLERNDNFYMLDKQYKIDFPYDKESKYILYINSSEIKVNNTIEKVNYSTKTEVCYINTSELEFLNGFTYRRYNKDTKEYELTEGNKIQAIRTGEVRHVLTEFGKEVEKVKKYLNDKKISISLYDLEKLIENKKELINILNEY